MIAITAEALLYGIFAFFLLGVVSYFTYRLIRLMFDLISSIPELLSALHAKKKPSLKYPWQILNSLSKVPLSKDIALALTVLILGFFYTAFAYIFLDGVLRLLPFLSLLFGIYIIFKILGERFDKFNSLIKPIILSLSAYPYYFGLYAGGFLYKSFNTLWNRFVMRIYKGDRM